MKWNLLWYIIPSLALGILFTCLASNQSLVTKQINVIDKNGQISPTTDIDYSNAYKTYNFLSQLFITLSFSIFIAGFITNAIEKKQREKDELELEKLRQAINVDVFDSLFKTIIPKEIFSIIKSEIIMNKVIRKDANWYYDFTTEDDKIILRQTKSQKIINNSDEFVSNPFRIEIDNCPTSDSILEYASCMLEHNKTIVYSSEDLENNQGVNIEHIDEYKSIIDFKIEIPPKREVEFTLIFKNIYNGVCYDEYRTFHPLVNANLIVNFPIEYEFSIYSSMSSEMKLMIDEPSRKIYQLKGAILPKQGFSFNLLKKNYTQHAL